MSKRIALDVDGVCLGFDQAFIQYCHERGVELFVDKVWNFFDQDVRSYQLFAELTDDFWLNLPRIDKSLDLNFVPVAYISHRTCSEEVTRQSLLNAGFPDAPVIHVKYTEEKVKVFKELNADIFIDDRASTVTFFLENGLDAFLLDQIWNVDYNLPRIETLGEINNK